MTQKFIRKYNQAATINFVLFEVDGIDFRIDAAHAAGDTVIMKDEGAEASTDSGFVDEGQGYSLALTATEMSAARIVVYVVDLTATKVWLDEALVIETYGNASAEHAFDLDTATQDVNVASTDTDAITATSIAADAIGASELATDAIGSDQLAATATAEMADAVWDEVLAGHTTTDTPGQVLNMLTQDTVTLSTDVALGSIIGQLLDAGTTWTYDRTTDSLEILGASVAPTVAAIADAVWDELIAGHNAAGTFGNSLQSITNGDIADAIWDFVIEAGANANNQTAQQILRIIVAALAGASSDTGDWDALAIDGVKQRIVASLTASGKRSAITTLDGSA